MHSSHANIASRSFNKVLKLPSVVRNTQKKEQVTVLSVGLVSSITLNLILPRLTLFNSFRQGSSGQQAGALSSAKATSGVISEIIFCYYRFDARGQGV